jgi:hypothetical protein
VWWKSGEKGFGRQLKEWKETVKKRNLKASVMPGAQGKVGQQRRSRQVIAQVERAGGER